MSNEVPPAKSKVLAVPWGPVARKHRRAATPWEHQRGEETLAHHGIEDSIMQFLSRPRNQIAHALAPAKTIPAAIAFVVIGAVSSSHHHHSNSSMSTRSRLRPTTPGHDTPCFGRERRQSVIAGDQVRQDATQPSLRCVNSITYAARNSPSRPVVMNVTLSTESG